MVTDDTVARSRALLPWGPDEGVPEVVVPRPPTSATPPSMVRATIEVRALPDGTPQLLASVDGGARVIRLSRSPTRVDIQTTGQVVDAVLDIDGSAIVLERLDDAFTARRVRPDGTSLWGMVDVAAKSARLLTDARGRVFLSSNDFLMEVDDRPSRLVSRRPQRGDAVMHPDGRVGFVHYDTNRAALDWVMLDPTTGGTSVIKGGGGTGAILDRVIGMDAAGRVYGDSSYYYSVGRMTSSGHLDWRVGLAGIAVSARHGVTVLSRKEDGNGTLLDEGGRVPVDLREYDRAQLVGRRDDGGYLLHKPDYGNGSLLHLDTHGRLIEVQSAGSDVWLTTDISQRPSASSVTPDGEVLVAVLTPAGVNVVGLKAGTVMDRDLRADANAS